MKMKKIWVALLFAGMSFGMGSCMKEDIDDIRKELQEHDDRLTSLEEWQKSVNTDISSLQSLVEALEDKDYVTEVTPLADGSGYEISFLKSGKITIKNGEKGEKGEAGNTPVISVKQDTDKKYYWTVNGEWLLDGDNNKMPVTGEKGDKGDTGNDGLTPHIGDNGNWWVGTTDTGVKAQGNTGDDGLTPHIGDNGNWWIGTTDTGVKAQGEQGDPGTSAIAPQVRINTDTNEWEISTDGGKTWTSTGVTATGPTGPSGAACGISDINIKDNTVIFSLRTGEQFTIPLTTSAIKFSDLEEITEGNNTFTAESEFFKQNDLVIQVRVESKTADGMDILTRTASENRWEISSSLSGNQLSITVNPAKGTAMNETAILKVEVYSKDGQLLATGQKVFANGIFEGVLSVSSFSDLMSQLAKVDKTKTTDLKITGSFDDYIAYNDLYKLINEIKGFSQIGTLEISVPQITTLAPINDVNMKVFKSEYITSLAPNGSTFDGSSVEEVYLPNVTALKQMDFNECSNLRKVYLPNVVEARGAQTFYNCTQLETLDLPNLTSLTGDLARKCTNLKEVNIPKATSLPSSSFEECISLTSLSLPEVTTMGGDVFQKCTNLVSISLPKVTVLPRRAFAECVSLSGEIKLDAVEEVGESAFSGCTKIVTVTLNNATSIGKHAFSGCTAMQTATLKKVTKIGEEAFKNCSNLTLLGLGCVTEVADYAFEYFETKSCALRFWEGEPTVGDWNGGITWCGKKWQSVVVF